MNADFYVRDATAAPAMWIGSLRDHNGWPGPAVALAQTPDAYRAAVLTLIRESPSGVLPDRAKQHNGWPWSYPDSSRTRYVYLFGAVQLHLASYGSAFMPVPAWRADRQDFQYMWSILPNIKRFDGLVGSVVEEFPCMTDGVMSGRFDVHEVHLGE